MKRDKKIYLINPWNTSTKEVTWGWVKDWAAKNIHPTDAVEWGEEAKNAVVDGDWKKLGKMIIGS